MAHAKKNGAGPEEQLVIKRKDRHYKDAYGRERLKHFEQLENDAANSGAIMQMAKQILDLASQQFAANQKLLEEQRKAPVEDDEERATVEE